MARTQRLFCTTSPSRKGGKGCFWMEEHGGTVGHCWGVLCCVHSHENHLPLSNTLLLISLLLLFSYFITVCSKLFLFQPTIFTFCASNSSLLPAAAGGRGSSERALCGLECYSGNTKLGNTIP